jgi:hypothetical protein
VEAKDLQTLRHLLIDALRGQHSHLDFADAIKDFPEDGRGKKLPGAPHTAWQLLEHLRIAQWDILEFSRNPKHQSPHWPKGYWPETEAPPDKQAWDKSVAAFEKQAQEFNHLIEDRHSDLFQAFAHGDGQTLLREALVLANHNSYHLGQLVFLKKSL